jgi:3-oxoacyl-[acyl-carrier protein] reductase
LAIAKAFASEGARVVISGRDEKTGQAAAASIGELASFISCDVTDKGSIDALMKAVLEKWKKLDILVNNAGGATVFAPIMEMDDEMWQTILDLNLTSTARHCALRRGKTCCQRLHQGPGQGGRRPRHYG